MEKKNLTDELISVFQELPTVIKPDARNDFQKYDYASIQAIKTIVSKKLKEHGILFQFNIKDVKNTVFDDGKILTDIFGEAKFVKGTEEVVYTIAGQAVDSQGKGLSKAKSDALKRFFTDNFLIATGDEDDEKDYGQETEPTQSDNSHTSYGAFGIAEPDAPLSDKQRKAIWAISKKAGIDDEAIHAYIKMKYKKEHIEQLTKAEASELIDELQKESK